MKTMIIDAILFSCLFILSRSVSHERYIVLLEKDIELVGKSTNSIIRDLEKDIEHQLTNIPEKEYITFEKTGAEGGDKEALEKALDKLFEKKTKVIHIQRKKRHQKEDDFIFGIDLNTFGSRYWYVVNLEDETLTTEYNMELGMKLIKFNEETIDEKNCHLIKEKLKQCKSCDLTFTVPRSNDIAKTLTTDIWSDKNLKTRILKQGLMKYYPEQTKKSSFTKMDVHELNHLTMPLAWQSYQKGYRNKDNISINKHFDTFEKILDQSGELTLGNVISIYQNSFNEGGRIRSQLLIFFFKLSWILEKRTKFKIYLLWENKNDELLTRFFSQMMDRRLEDYYYLDSTFYLFTLFTKDVTNQLIIRNKLHYHFDLVAYVELVDVNSIKRKKKKKKKHQRFQNRTKRKGKKKVTKFGAKYNSILRSKDMNTSGMGKMLAGQLITTLVPDNLTVATFLKKVTSNLSEVCENYDKTIPAVMMNVLKGATLPASIHFNCMPSAVSSPESLQEYRSIAHIIHHRWQKFSIRKLTRNLMWGSMYYFIQLLLFVTIPIRSDRVIHFFNTVQSFMNNVLDLLSNNMIKFQTSIFLIPMIIIVGFYPLLVFIFLGKLLAIRCFYTLTISALWLIYMLNEISFLSWINFMSALVWTFVFMLYNVYIQDFYFSIFWFIFSFAVPLLLSSDERKNFFCLYFLLKKKSEVTSEVNTSHYYLFVGHFMSFCTNSFLYISGFELFLHYVLGIQTSPWFE